MYVGNPEPLDKSLLMEVGEEQHGDGKQGSEEGAVRQP